MGTLIANLSGEPLTLPLPRAALIPPGGRVIYASLDPEEIIASLGGAAVVRELHLDVQPIDAARAPVDEGLANLGGIGVIPAASLPDAAAKYRGTVAIVLSDAGVADDVVACLKLADDSYAWVSLVS